MAAAAILLAAPGIARAGTAGLAGVAVGDGAIVLRFDAPVAGASAFMLAGPQRIAVDVDGAAAGRVRDAVGGPVLATRLGVRRGGGTRVVFDLATPAVVTGGGFDADGRTLRLAIAATAPAGFARAVHARARSFLPPPPSSLDEDRYDGPRPVPAAYSPATYRPAAYSPARAGGRTVSVPLDAPQPFRAARVRIEGGDATRPLVVIDPGHGGHDPGSSSIWGDRKEKDAALAIGRAIRDELVASGKVRVAMTRDDDRFIVLGERREIARRLHADLFISVHADSAPNSDTARGATIYTLSEVASDKVAARLAARENRADILNGVNLGRETPDVSSILLDLTQRETMNVSSAFAALLQREMSPLVPFKTGFHRFASLVVLKAPDVPSVLLETGYMSNMADSRMLFSAEGQHDIAVGVRRAVVAHFARRLADR